MKARNGRARIACECGCGVLLDMTFAEYMRHAKRGVMVVVPFCADGRIVVKWGRGWAVVKPKPAEAAEVAA
jgi:hypothetical protein